MTTFYAKRGNKILKINEDAVARYLGQGYTITDMAGNVIKKGTPHDANLLTAEVKRQDAEIATLKEENAKLMAEIKAYRVEIEELKKELDKFKSMPISEPAKTTRKRKATTDVESEA